MAVWVNRGIEIKGYIWMTCTSGPATGSRSFLQYVFPVGSTRFRFLYYLAAWLEMAVVRNHVGWFVPFNILLNAAVSWSIYFHRPKAVQGKGNRLSVRLHVFNQPHGLLPDWTGAGAYGNHGPVDGCYDSLVFVPVSSNEKDSHVYFYLSCVLYFGVCFVHERYMAPVSSASSGPAV